MDNVYGIAFHSPLDVDTLLPFQLKATLDPTQQADVLYSKVLVSTFTPKFQLVFDSMAELMKNNLQILDVNKSGEIIELKTENLEKVLSTVVDIGIKKKK